MVAMMVRKGVFVLALVLLVSFLNSAARAGGSFAFEDLLPILNQQPVLAKWLSGSLEFDQTGDAVRLGQNVNPRFGGRRVGPYVILAKPKGVSGPFTLEVTVNTDLICQNKVGKPVDFTEAYTMQEKFSAVTVKPYRESK